MFVGIIKAADLDDLPATDNDQQSYQRLPHNFFEFGDN